jgi:oligopeptide/dipeptide ABC transporter ATP-binding protein
MAAETLLEIRGLKKYFYPFRLKKNRELKAVNGVDITIRPGETLGLVGESGCGKSTLGRLILRLLSATEGEIFFEGENILTYDRRKMKEVRRRIQMIFQNPYASLNPRMRILDAVRAPLDVYHIGTGGEKLSRVREMFDLVGMDEKHLYRYPHEFSGGQRQRIAIARSLVSNPRFIICDEPVSSLDVSVRAQVLNLMKDIQQNLGISYLFISHDLSVVYHICSHVAVMYLGKIVETAPKEEIYAKARHPYTKTLLQAVLQPEADPEQKRVLPEGEIPSPMNIPTGCGFHTRCPGATVKCYRESPPLLGGEHRVACHYAGGA